MKSSAYTVMYSLALGVVCAVLLTGASIIARPYKEANARAAEERTILNVLLVPVSEKASPAEVSRVFEENVRREEAGGRVRYIYVGTDGGTPKAVAIPFSGPGLWGPIRGFLALEPDMRTVRNVIFHEQEETPGLGGEIGSTWFQEQFRGKSIVDEAGKPGIRILRGGKASGRNEVDGITGATMTCEKVKSMLDTFFAKIIQEQNTNDR
ncbi:MAG TPA: FMN-binding protein [Planctomycetota bacterium]|nr:FMN-binding protein [Planctomycetota bacterium]